MSSNQEADVREKWFVCLGIVSGKKLCKGWEEMWRIDTLANLM